MAWASCEKRSRGQNQTQPATGPDPVCLPKREFVSGKNPDDRVSSRQKSRLAGARETWFGMQQGVEVLAVAILRR